MVLVLLNDVTDISGKVHAFSYQSRTKRLLTIYLSTIYGRSAVPGKVRTEGLACQACLEKKSPPGPRPSTLSGGSSLPRMESRLPRGQSRLASHRLFDWSPLGSHQTRSSVEAP